ncbi:17631_t:CDS:10, partial [Acaulospora colombiana]
SHTDKSLAIFGNPVPLLAHSAMAAGSWPPTSPYPRLPHDTPSSSALIQSFSPAIRLARFNAEAFGGISLAPRGFNELDNSASLHPVGATMLSASAQAVGFAKPTPNADNGRESKVYTDNPKKNGDDSEREDDREPQHVQARKKKPTMLFDELSGFIDDDRNRRYHLFDTEDYEDPSLKLGIEDFKCFERVMYALDRSLITFQLSARQLDSSVGSLASAGQLRSHLMNIGILFQRNAAEIFPQMKSKLAKIDTPKPRKKRPKPRAKIYSRASILKPTTINEIPEPETLPSELSEFASNLAVFLRQLEEFPEFADDTLTTSITALEIELKRRADCLAEYRHQLHWPAVQRYVHAISAELVSPLQTMNQALEDFVNNGIPAIRFAQKNSWNYLVNLSVTATFFSGVTATTAQYSLDRTATTLDDQHNGMKWLSDVLHGYWDSFLKPIRSQLMRWIPRRAIAQCQAFGKRLTCRLNRNRGPSDELNETESGGTILSPIEYKHKKSASELERGDMIDSPIAQPSQLPEAGVSHSVPKFSFSAASIAVPNSDSQHTLNEQAPTASTTTDPPKLTGVNRLRQLAWKVAEKETLQVPKTQTNSRGSAVLYTMHTIVGRLTTLRPVLKRLEVTHTILRSSGLVRHLQFSPNGKLLATCAWDGTARLFNVPQSADDDVGKHLVMNVYTGFLGQVAWSPNGNWLITRWANGMAIWSEGSQVSELDLDGNVVEMYEFQNLEIHTVAITPDEERMLCVGVPKSQGSTQPSTSRVEKRLV